MLSFVVWLLFSRSGNLGIPRTVRSAHSHCRWMGKYQGWDIWADTVGFLGKPTI